jgi:hypothetical protein
MAVVYLLISSLAGGREITMKEGAEKYYAHASLDHGTAVGADLLGRYLPITGMTIYSDQYLFVEVAFFGPVSNKPDFKYEQFSLRVNGTALTRQAPGMVTLENHFPEMVERTQIVLDGGTGTGQIEVGGQERKPRFPGDDPGHTPAQIPKVPTDGSNGQVQPNPQDPGDAVKASELLTGPHPLPIGGYLFFHYEGKLKKIKHAELLYKGPLGSATLTLR